MRLLWIFIAIATISICVYPALKLKPSRRLVTLLVLAISVALLPLFVPSEAKIARFCVALMAAITVFKIWDLLLSLAKGSRPDFRAFLGIVANLYFLVFRKHGVERQATKLSSLKDLALGTAGLAAVLGGLSSMRMINWSANPFLLEHTLITSGLFLFTLTELTIWVRLRSTSFLQPRFLRACTT